VRGLARAGQCHGAAEFAVGAVAPEADGD